MKLIKTTMKNEKPKWDYQPPSKPILPPNFATKMSFSRDFPKTGMIVNPFTMEFRVLTDKDREFQRKKHDEMMKLMELMKQEKELQKKELFIISFDNLKLDEEVKTKDDDDAYHAEEDTDTLQEELFDEVGVLPSDPETKKTEMLV